MDCEVGIAQSREKWMLLQLTYIPTAEPLIHYFFPFLLFLLSLSSSWFSDFLISRSGSNFPPAEKDIYMNRKIAAF